MTLEGMNAYLRDKGFEVHRERDSKRDCYVFTIHKPGYEAMTRDFKYPKSDDWKYKNEQMEKFLNQMVRDFYKGEGKQDMNTLNFDHPIFQTRGDAENTLAVLETMIKLYGYATIADLYEEAGLNSTYKDSEYGWTNLHEVDVTRTPSGYILQLPAAVELEPKRVKSSVSYRNYSSQTPRFGCLPEITNVIYNDPATIVFWADGTKTVVKRQEGYQFDPMAGLSMAICEKAFGNKANSHKVFNKWLPKEDEVDISKELDRLETECHKVDRRLSLIEAMQAVDEFGAKFKKSLEDLMK